MQEKRVHDLELMLYGGEVMSADAAYGGHLFGHMDGANTRSHSTEGNSFQMAATDPNRIYAKILIGDEPDEILIHKEEGFR